MLGASCALHVGRTRLRSQALCAHPPYLPPALTAAGDTGADVSTQDNGRWSFFRSLLSFATREEPGSAAPHHLPANAEAAHLDRTFRLLREDYMSPLRQALRLLGLGSTGSAAPAAAGDAVLGEEALRQMGFAPATDEDEESAAGGAAGARRRAAQSLLRERLSVSAASVMRNVYPMHCVVGLEQFPRACVLVSVSLPPSFKAARMRTAKEREEYWCGPGVHVAARLTACLSCTCSMAQMSPAVRVLASHLCTLAGVDWPHRWSSLIECPLKTRLVMSVELSFFLSLIGPQVLARQGRAARERPGGDRSTAAARRAAPARAVRVGGAAQRQRAGG
jgi:hypothetical protein